MSVIARDTVASDHLVYAWPFPIGPECEVACAEDEQVVMCPAWVVGDRLGPGRHRWRTHDPSRPVAAYFVLTAPVEVSFDMTTSFLLPANGQPIRLRANGSMQVRCSDPGLLIAQFVGLPFDTVNHGVLKSVSRSVERMIARLLIRRVVMAGTPMAVTDTSMLANIIEELVAYNPTAGAVFGVELIRMGHLTIVADDGSTPYIALPEHSGNHRIKSVGNGEATTERQPANTMRGLPPVEQPVSRRHHLPTEPPPIRAIQTSQVDIKLPPPALREVSGEIGGPKPVAGNSPPARSGEISGRVVTNSEQAASSSGEIIVRSKSPADIPAQRHAAPIEIPSEEPEEIDEIEEIRPEEIMQPVMTTPLPGALRAPPSPAAAAPTPTPVPAIPARPASKPMAIPAIPPMPGVQPRRIPVIAMASVGTNAPAADDESARGSIMGIGTVQIGSGAVAGEIGNKVKPGSRVLVPGPNGLMQSATVRQLLQGYYELEVGSSGETIWVPINGVIPEN